MQRQKCKNDQISEIKSALDGLNTQKADFISRNELILLLSSFGEKMSKLEIETVLSRMSLNTEKISITQFIEQLSVLC